MNLDWSGGLIAKDLKMDAVLSRTMQKQNERAMIREISNVGLRQPSTH
jgi:hypothetical protein